MRKRLTSLRGAKPLSRFPPLDSGPHVLRPFSFAKCKLVVDSISIESKEHIAPLPARNRGREMTTPYAKQIQAIAPTYDPRHIEAFMRCENGTLDHLSPKAFAGEVTMAVLCIEEGGREQAERLAKSYGF